MSTSRFITGAVCGLVIGLLVAPSKGSELREDIADTAVKLKKRLNSLAGHADASLNDLHELLESNIEGLSEDVRHRILTILDDAAEMAYSAKMELTKNN